MRVDFIKMLAAWALIHEAADEGWKAAVKKGQETGPGGMEGSPDAFVEGLAAMVAEEKDRLKSRLSQAGSGGPAAAERSEDDLSELRFEIAQVRTRLESMETALDTILGRLEQALEGGQAKTGNE